MPLEIKIWKMEATPRSLAFEQLASESRLEKLLIGDISILSPQFFLIGSQVLTSFGKFIDLLAIDDEGNLIVIELKRGKTPRDAVAQLLDYASWADGLSYQEISRIYSEKHGGAELTSAYSSAMDAEAPAELSGQLRLLLVASLLDSESERILNYLSEKHSVPINAVFFRYFRDGDAEFLTRSWLIDPSTAEVNLAKSGHSRQQELWNGKDFYVAFGEDEHRRWNDAVTFGFVSAGGGRRYTRPLYNLYEGCRVFVHIPGRGYVGVGLVTGAPLPLKDFAVRSDEGEVPFQQISREGKYLVAFADNPDMAEYFVPIKWSRTVSTEEAFWKKGMYANQTVVTKLRSQFTLQSLCAFFQVEE